MPARQVIGAEARGEKRFLAASGTRTADVDTVAGAMGAMGAVT